MGFYIFSIFQYLLTPLAVLACAGWGIHSLLRKRDDGFRMVERSKSTKFFLLAPGLLNLALFYSLAIHMYQSLGGWPEGIGNKGFPAALDLHDEITSTYFICLLLFLLAWPLLLLVFAKIECMRRWRSSLVAAGVSAFLSIILTAGLPFILMPLHLHIAPAEFLNWWWD